MWITTNLPNVWRGTLWSQRLECSHYFRAHEAFMIGLLPNTQISNSSRAAMPPNWFGIAPKLHEPSLGGGGSPTRSPLLVSTSDRQQRAALADRVRWVYLFGWFYSFPYSSMSRAQVMKYNRVDRVLNVMDDPNTPSFGKGLLKFCYKRLCCQIWQMYNCFLGPNLKRKRQWKVQRIGGQWNSVERISPASHMRAVTTICWELTLFSCTSSLPPCPKRISIPSRSGLQLNNIC